MNDPRIGQTLADGRIIDRRGKAQANHAIVPVPSLERHQEYKRHGWVELTVSEAGEAAYQRRKEI